MHDHGSNRIGQKDIYDCDCDWTYLSSGMHLARSPISPLRAAILTSSLGDGRTALAISFIHSEFAQQI